ncbi:MAG TPA: discoidin domain-containing protein [Candidatus Limnocylindrales bacterium]|nr:discoidin domain-containing protein [Candidatus Limnocylindrales bacterium]
MTRSPGSTRSRVATLAALAALIATVLPAAPSPVMASTAHWIGVRPTAAGGGTELYDTRTSATFRPRGVNLLKDEYQSSGPYPILDVIVAPGEYDQAWLDTQLTAIARYGFNTIRVFLDLCPGDCLTFPDGSAKPAWLDNVAALITSAKNHGLVVLLTSNQLPEVGYEDQLPCCYPFDHGFDAQILSSEGLNLTLTYWRTVIGGLIERDVPLEAVLAYELHNESQFEGNRVPLSLSSGLVTTANGQTYDMADQTQKLDMLDDGLIFWADRVAETIKAIDPGALVTNGFFAPDEPHSVRPGDTRIVRTARFIRESSLDFFDFHAYPALDLQLWQIVDNFTFDGTVTKPVIMGEFGSIDPAHPDAAAAGQDLAGWQALSCSFGFDGWLGWVWGSLDPSVRKLTDDGHAIAAAISPLVRPDPCDGTGVPKNLAFGRPVIVDSELPGEEGAKAVDGLVLTDWNAGGGVPVSITIDLGSPQTIHEIRLLTAQFPAGATTHRIDVRKQKGGWSQVAKLTGITQGEQWLRFFASPALTGVRWVRIRTTMSPSWVSWREIQVF